MKLHALKCIQKPNKSRLSLTHHATNPAVEQNKNVNWLKESVKSVQFLISYIMIISL